MCLLTFLPAGVQPDAQALTNGAEVNDDGHGFALVADHNLIVERGMHAPDVIAAFLALRRRFPDGPALFHSRLGTHGTRGLDNCHPFPIGGDSRTVVAHNGILPANAQPGKGDPRSDTRIAADTVLPTFGSLRHRRTRLRVQRWMSVHNKMVVLTVDRRFRQSAYILNEQAGVWDGQIWYSNHGYLPVRYPLLDPNPSRITRGTRRWDEDLLRCDYCAALVEDGETQCWCCGWCLDCEHPPQRCTCRPWLPTLYPADRNGR